MFWPQQRASLSLTDRPVAWDLLLSEARAFQAEGLQPSQQTPTDPTVPSLGRLPRLPCPHLDILPKGSDFQGQ